MPEPNNVSIDDLRRAMLNVADAVRITSEALDRLALRLSLIPTLEPDPFWHQLRESVRPVNGRLSAALDLLIKEEVQHSS